MGIQFRPRIQVTGVRRIEACDFLFVRLKALKPRY